MPDRLSDVINVKDWGAIGDNSHNDSSAIQNAIDYCISRGGGKVFFPPGAYALGVGNFLSVGSSNPNARVELIGSGRDYGAMISGNYSSGFLISQGSGAYDNLQRLEGISIFNASTASGTGAIKVTGTGVSIYSSYMSGMVLVDASQANGCSICDTSGLPNDQNGTADSTYPLSLSGIGFYLGNGCTAMDCRVNGNTWIAFALSGVGAAVIGGSAEVCTIAARLGWGPSGDTPAKGCTVQNLATERCMYGIELYNCQACLIEGNYLFGNVGVPTEQNVTNMSWKGSSHVITVTVGTDHNLPAGHTPLLLRLWGMDAEVGSWRENMFAYATKLNDTQFSYPGPPTDPGAWSGTISSMSWNPSTHVVTVGITTTKALIYGMTVTLTGLDDSWSPAGAGHGVPFYVSVTGGDTIQFTYDGPSSEPTAFTRGTWRLNASWTYPQRYALRCRKVSETAILANGLDMNCAYASVDLDYDNDANTIHKSNVFIGAMPNRGGWKLPTATKNLAGWYFSQVGVTSTTTNAVYTLANPRGTMVFADLPGEFSDPTGVYQPGPIEGQEYDINDGQKEGGGAAGFAENVQGGSNGHYKVRYNGQAGKWQRIG
jgi:hypothetical protein